MRLGVIAENIVERLVLKSNAAPEPLLETQMAFSMARSIMAGVKLGVFEAVGGGARSAEEIAKTCATSPGATEKLLNALTGCGHFKFRNGAYELTGRDAEFVRAPHGADRAPEVVRILGVPAGDRCVRGRGVQEGETAARSPRWIASWRRRPGWRADSR
jgi:hypothetical protein